MKNVSLVIAESGTGWTDCIRTWRTPDNELVVLIQQHEESHQEFQCRVASRFERLRSPAVRLDQILHVAGSCRQDPCRLPRAQLLDWLRANGDRGAGSMRVDRIEGWVAPPPPQDLAKSRCGHCSSDAISQLVPSASGS
jgi:hypothetical protein